MCGSDLSYNLIMADRTNGSVLTGHNEFAHTISISTVLCTEVEVLFLITMICS